MIFLFVSNLYTQIHLLLILILDLIFMYFIKRVNIKVKLNIFIIFGIIFCIFRTKNLSQIFNLNHKFYYYLKLIKIFKLIFQIKIIRLSNFILQRLLNCFLNLFFLFYDLFAIKYQIKLLMHHHLFNIKSILKILNLHELKYLLQYIITVMPINFTQFKQNFIKNYQ